MGAELLWTVFEWLPLVFAIDLLAFHATGDHPLALRWWWSRSAARSRERRALVPAGRAQPSGAGDDEPSGSNPSSSASRSSSPAVA